MKIKNKIKKDPFSLLLIISVLIVSILTLSNFEGLEYLRGLIYPTTTTDEISGQKANRLKILVFNHNHKIDKEYERTESGTVNIIEPEDFAGTYGPDEVIESNENMENIILEPGSGSGDFVGWSGCDAETNNQCQISVTNHQKRKVEAHYSNPEPRDSLQLFSVSNNSLGGQLTDDWTNVNPALVYKAAYIDLDGEIPSTIENLSPDLQLTLGGNSLEGEIPPEIGDLSGTDYIGLQKNQLSGETPPEIGDLHPIYLLAYQNNLSGPIPSEIGDLGSQVQRFEFHENNLEDEVPYELIQIDTLNPNELRLYGNNLSATEPGFMADAPWDGINFHNNSFSANEQMNSLNEAATGSSSGDYIDFCGNSSSPLQVNYEINGDWRSTNTQGNIQTINNALNDWERIYVEVSLSQTFRRYPNSCDVDQCSPSWDDEEEECTNTSTDCSPSGARNYTATPPNHRSPVCVEISEELQGNEDDLEAMERLGEVPVAVEHAAEHNQCSYYDHPECEAVCESDGSCGGGSESSCLNNDWECIHEGRLMDGNRSEETNENAESAAPRC